jgi:dipeptidyl aminopeptidase/acylaminoacyl peptidase
VAPARPSRRWWWAGAGLLGAAVIAGLAFVAGRRGAEKPLPEFKQLTFRRGWVDEARFAPDGQTIVYGAAWDGRPVELFQTRTDNPESRPLGLAHAKVLSISSQGQMAILLDPSRRQSLIAIGTLAVVPLVGGTPREVLENVFWADWTPDGRDLCVARMQPNGEVTIELPPGTVLHRTHGYTCMLHVSRDGRHIVFAERANGKMVLIDRDRKVTRTLVEPLAAGFWGLAWGPTGREVWFTESPRRTARDVHAVDLEGRRRVVYRSAGVLALMDSAPDGRILLHRALDRIETIALLPGRQVEQDVTVYDNSIIGALSSDGRLLLLDGIEEEKGRFVYLRRDGGDPVRLAAGIGVGISPDGRSALIVTDTGELSEVPIGPGLPRKIDLGNVRADPRPWAGRGGIAYVPSPRGAMIVRGRERPDEPYNLWLIHEGVSKPRRLELDVHGGVESWGVAPDGRHVAVKTRSDTIRVAALARGASRDIRIPDVDLSVSRWSGDGRSLFLARAGWPCEIHRLDLATEKVELWKRVAPPDPTGILQCIGPLPSADGRSYVYTANRSLAALIVAEGLR